MSIQRKYSSSERWSRSIGDNCNKQKTEMNRVFWHVVQLLSAVGISLMVQLPSVATYLFHQKKKKKKVKPCEVYFLSDYVLSIALETPTLKKLHGLKQFGWHRKFFIYKWKFKKLLPNCHLGKYSALEHISTFPPNARQITEPWTHLPFKKSIMLGGSLWILEVIYTIFEYTAQTHLSSNPKGCQL